MAKIDTEVPDTARQVNRESVIDERFDELVPVNKSGFAVEKVAQVVVPQPAAHARPEHLDPRTNGPFLDEYEEHALEKARNLEFVRSDLRKEKEKRASKAKNSDAPVVSAADEGFSTGPGDGEVRELNPAARGNDVDVSSTKSKEAKSGRKNQPGSVATPTKSAAKKTTAKKA